MAAGRNGGAIAPVVCSAVGGWGVAGAPTEVLIATAPSLGRRRRRRHSVRTRRRGRTWTRCSSPWSRTLCCDASATAAERRCPSPPIGSRRPRTSLAASSPSPSSSSVSERGSWRDVATPPHDRYRCGDSRCVGLHVALETYRSGLWRIPSSLRESCAVSYRSLLWETWEN